MFEQVRDTSYHWAIIVKGYPFSFVIWNFGVGGVVVVVVVVVVVSYLLVLF